jgi:hypothetical protein
VTRAVLDQDDGRATISGWLKDEVRTLADLLNVNPGLPATFGGQPLRTIHVQARGAGGAFYWGRYQRRRRGGTTFIERHKRHVGYTHVEWWGSFNTEDVVHTEADPRTLKMVPTRRRLRASLVTITWGGELANPPVDTRDIENTRNSGPYRIDSYLYPAGSLLFVGTVSRHLKDGGIDRWVYRHTAMYRAFYSTQNQLRYWEESQLVLNNNTTPKTLRVELVGPYPVASWPALL